MAVEDNTRPHDGELPERFRQQLNIVRFPHSLHSPDLDAIENLRAVLKVAVKAREPVAQYRSELIRHVNEGWGKNWNVLGYSSQRIRYHRCEWR